MIKLSNICVNYPNKTIFQNASIIIPQGKLCCISGKSGSGKTTLFYMLGLISSWKNYSYEFDGYSINLKDEKLKSDIRKNKIGFIFQDQNLHDYLTIEDNIKLYTYISGKTYDVNKAKELLNKVHLDKDLNEKCIHLSRGEKQRLTIACALSKDPDLLICDEATSALDDENRDSILILLKEIARSGKMVIIASHSKEVIDFCDIHYTIENCMIHTDDLISPNHCSFQTKLSEINQSFNRWYTAFDFGSKKLTKIILTTLPVLLITCSIVLNGIRDGLVSKYQNSIDSKLNEVLVEYRNGIPKSVFSTFEKGDGVDEIYGMNKKTIYDESISEERIQVVPYLDFQISTDLVDIYNEEGEVFVSYNLYVDNPIITVEGKEYVIKGVFKENYSLVQGEINNTIYIPYTFSDSEEYNMVLLTMNSFEALEGLSSKIHQYYPAYDVTLSQGDYMGQIKILDQYKETLNQFIIITSVIIIIFLTIVQYFTINNSKYEITVLKANGLNRKEVLMMMGYWTFRKITTSILLTCVLISISIVFCTIIQFPIKIFSTSIFILILVLIAGIYILPSILLTAYISSMSCEKLLRF